MKKVVCYGVLGNGQFKIYEWGKVLPKLFSMFWKGELVHLTVTITMQSELKTNPQLKYWYGFLRPAYEAWLLETQGLRVTEEQIEYAMKRMAGFGTFVEKTKRKDADFIPDSKAEATKERISEVLDILTTKFEALGIITLEQIDNYKYLRNE